MDTSLLPEETRANGCNAQRSKSLTSTARSTLTGIRKILATWLSFLLVAVTIPDLPVFSQTQGSPPGYAGQGAPMSANQIQQLVSPIALYPDALVAQVLGAATFPDQIAFADDWLQQNKNLTGQSLLQAVNDQAWDPSVKALTQFPSVLDNMAKSLSWTSALGETYQTQHNDVMTARMVGGFALVAYPAEYGNSGVMTFIINQDGVLLQKDLGKDTTQTATAMTKFDPDKSWTIVESFMAY